MTAFRKREVISLKRLWRDKTGQPWLVTFDLADLDGRAECVGMSIRSYLALPVPDDKDPIYGATAWVPGSALEDDVDPGDWSIAGDGNRALLRELLRDELGAGDLMKPQTLLAETVRRLPFGTVLEKARRAEVEFLRDLETAIGPDPSRAAVELLTRWKEEESALGQPTPRGRRRKYRQSDLELVAMLYREAFDKHSHSPTKDVAVALGIPHSTAAKLVGRCRDPKVNLLAPTRKSKAGGTRPSLPEGPSRESGQNHRNERREQP
jgi:hypothetical protein